jgi:hypothetical protein
MFKDATKITATPVNNHHPRDPPKLWLLLTCHCSELQLGIEKKGTQDSGCCWQVIIKLRWLLAYRTLN